MTESYQFLRKSYATIIIVVTSVCLNVGKLTSISESSAFAVKYVNVSSPLNAFGYVKVPTLPAFEVKRVQSYA